MAFSVSGNDFVHPVASIVVAGDGTIVRYLYGVSILPKDLTLALVEARSGVAGGIDPQGDGLLLQLRPGRQDLCLQPAAGERHGSHPLHGRFSCLSAADRQEKATTFHGEIMIPDQHPQPRSFWNDTGKTGIASWIFSTDHKRIGLLYFYSHLRLLPGRGAARPAAPHRADGAGADHHGAPDLQRPLHRARGGDDLPLHHPRLSGLLRQPGHADPDRRPRRRLSRA